MHGVLLAVSHRLAIGFIQVPPSTLCDSNIHKRLIGCKLGCIPFLLVVAVLYPCADCPQRELLAIGRNDCSLSHMGGCGLHGSAMSCLWRAGLVHCRAAVWDSCPQVRHLNSVSMHICPYAHNHAAILHGFTVHACIRGDS